MKKVRGSSNPAQGDYSSGVYSGTRPPLFSNGYFFDPGQGFFRDLPQVIMVGFSLAFILVLGLSLSQYPLSQILVIWKNIAAGHPFDLKMLLLECALVFNFTFLAYRLSGGERTQTRFRPLEKNTDHALNNCLLPQTVFSSGDHMAFTTYKAQQAGPSIFSRPNWKNKLNQAVQVPGSIERGTQSMTQCTQRPSPDSVKGLKPAPLEEVNPLSNEPSYMMLDLQDLSKGLMDLPEEVSPKPRGLDTHIADLLREQEEVYKPSKVGSRDPSKKVNERSSEGFLKVVYVSS